MTLERAQIMNFAPPNGSNKINDLSGAVVRGAKALAKGDLGLNFSARGILESAFL